ncbi:MAG: rhodanese-like domain-containing protein [Lentisphaeria bacterium]|nr:rhodanese-like domain-containing protein [Lentisphaeria bacterium]
MKVLRFVLVWSCAAAAVCGCACGNTESTSNNGASAEQPVRIDLNTAVLLDVRSPEEYASGYLKGARNIPHDRIGAEIAAVVPDKSAQVILYCRSGRRAKTALETMRAMGYANVSNFGGLEDAQERLGLPVITK